jgi:hypothetical protein
MEYRSTNDDLIIIGKLFLEGLGLSDSDNDVASCLLKLQSDIAAASNMTNINHADLVEIRNNGRLIPGRQYRIIDYMTTTTQAAMEYNLCYISNTRSAGHQFDIILTADSANKLNENAKAIQHEGDDTYFNNSNLAAWELKYCLDNDTNRFGWADATNGKGVIYYMKDEFENECSYDFKNIQFQRKLDENGLYVPENGSANDNSDEPILEWCYTFGGHLYDSSLSINEDFKTFKNNVIGSFNFDNKFWLPDNVFLDLQAGITEYNILHDNCICNTFSYDCSYNELGIDCRKNIFESGCHNNHFASQCSNNTFGDSCKSNTFGYGCIYNKFKIRCEYNTLGDSCKRNIFEENCFRNTFGCVCENNTFGKNCYNNEFGNMCTFNTFGLGCINNEFENECNSNTFGQNCEYNTFGQGCYNNEFGWGCNNNTFGVNCAENTFGLGCLNNKFENDCQSNTFGKNCDGNTFGHVCDGNTFSINCNNNTFGAWCSNNRLDGNSQMNRFGNNCSNNIFGECCSKNILEENCTYIDFISRSDGDRYIGFYENITVGQGNAYMLLQCTDTSKYYPFRNIRITPGCCSGQEDLKTNKMEHLDILDGLTITVDGSSATFVVKTSNKVAAISSGSIVIGKKVVYDNKSSFNISSVLTATMGV